MSDTNIKLDKPILLFDGVCNFCNSSVNFIVDRNSKKNILFSSLQSQTGQQLLEKFNLPKDNFNSLVLVDGDNYYTKSTAALKIAEYLDGNWKFLSILKIIPKFIRDFGYDFIAKNRYKIFGKSDQCRIPTKEMRERFLN
jgi:predicted DCC family thiol-disulfide oxidoreductase YuxK